MSLYGAGLRILWDESRKTAIFLRFPQMVLSSTKAGRTRHQESWLTSRRADCSEIPLNDREMMGFFRQSANEASRCHTTDETYARSNNGAIVIVRVLSIRKS